MKKDFESLMELIPAQYVEEAAAYREAHLPAAGRASRITWTVPLSAAACAVLAVGGFMLFGRGDENNHFVYDSMLQQVTEIQPAKTGTTATTAADISETAPRTAVTTARTAKGNAQTGTTATTAVSSAATAAQTTGSIAETNAAATDSPNNAQTAATQTTQTTEKHSFCVEVGGVWYQKGDFNMDGTIDFADEQAMLNLYTVIAVNENALPDDLSAEQLELGNLLNGEGITTVGGHIPFDILDTRVLHQYIVVHYMHEACVLEDFLKLSADERQVMVDDFCRRYKVKKEFKTEYSGGIVPIDAPDGYFINGVYYICGDVNMNGEIDIEDAELMEQLYEANCNGDYSYLTPEQGWLTGIKYQTWNEDTLNYYFAELKMSLYEKAQMIRAYVALKAEGNQLPESLYLFYKQIYDSE